MPDKLENIELRSEEVQDILTAIPNWMIRWGNTLVLLLILLMIAISWFVKYPDIISAETMITTQMPPQKEYAKLTGKLDSFWVENNQSVLANSPLAIIENSANFEDVFFLEKIVNSIRLNKKHFNFPIKDLPILFLGDIEADFALFENSYEQYLINKELRPFSNETIANQKSITELKSRLKNLELQQDLYASEMKLKKVELNRTKSLFEDGIIAAQEYENKQLENLQAERNFKNINASISQAKEAISNAGLSSKKIVINQTKEDRMLLRNVLQSFIKLKKAIKDWKLKYVLSAKIDGKVSFLDFWMKNQTVNAGDLVFIIIPQNNQEYIAKLRTPALNSGKIKIGQNVNIKLSNYSSTEFGVLNGRIKSISSMTDKDGFYLVDVSLSTQLITSYNKELEFKQEMQGTAEIITEDLRLIERFFYQLKEAFKA